MRALLAWVAAFSVLAGSAGVEAPAEAQCRRIIRLEPIFAPFVFRPASVEWSPENDTIAASVAEALTREIASSPGVVFDVIGDALADEPNAEALARARAQAVVDRLVLAGVERTRLRVAPERPGRDREVTLRFVWPPDPCR